MSSLFVLPEQVSPTPAAKKAAFALLSVAVSHSIPSVAVSHSIPLSCADASCDIKLKVLGF